MLSDVPVVNPVFHRFIVDPLTKDFDAKKIVMDECENAQSTCDTNSNPPKETVFHAIYIPQDKDSVNVEGKNYLK